jgi:hypothetical protein
MLNDAKFDLPIRAWPPRAWKEGVSDASILLSSLARMLARGGADPL